jgi:hypothetical protein
LLPQIQELEQSRRIAEEERARAQHQSRLKREREMMRMAQTQDKEVSKYISANSR